MSHMLLIGISLIRFNFSSDNIKKTSRIVKMSDEEWGNDGASSAPKQSNNDENNNSDAKPRKMFSSFKNNEVRLNSAFFFRMPKKCIRLYFHFFSSTMDTNQTGRVVAQEDLEEVSMIQDVVDMVAVIEAVIRSLIAVTIAARLAI
jgi:hypothetical protein